jgi:hypothetical protein
MLQTNAKERLGAVCAICDDFAECSLYASRAARAEARPSHAGIHIA